MIEFNKKGYPIIRLYDDYFEVKAIDFWEFRSFKYSEVTKIAILNESESRVFMPLLAAIFASRVPYTLKIFKKNGADWEYTLSPNLDKEFVSVINEIRKCCGLIS